MKEAWRAFARSFNDFNLTLTPPIVASVLVIGVIVLICAKPLIPKE